MVNPLPTPLPTDQDAWNRAIRTFIQGLWLDVSTALVLAIVAGLTDVQWTSEYWTGFGLMLLKTVVLAAASYVHRRLRPPPSA